MANTSIHFQTTKKKRNMYRHVARQPAIYFSFSKKTIERHSNANRGGDETKPKLVILWSLLFRFFFFALGVKCRFNELRTDFGSTKWSICISFCLRWVVISVFVIIILNFKFYLNWHWKSGQGLCTWNLSALICGIGFFAICFSRLQ